MARSCIAVVVAGCLSGSAGVTDVVAPHNCISTFCKHTVCGPDPCDNVIFLDGNSTGRRYDGHGAISSGATARLLMDYEEPYRSHVLDYLFEPNFGAALHLLKVEIGGDSQSGYGTEPSHMHHRSDLSCSRGYELWLLREARQRNPALVAYATSWALPNWVDVRDGARKDDHIQYLLQWLQCARSEGAGEIDYLGIQNPHEWGPVEWTVQLRTALIDAGFPNTRLIIPDGEYDGAILDAVRSDEGFAAALDGGGVGVHYPPFMPTPEVQALGLKFWSSEDHGVAADWLGSGCLGRTRNRNFVWMNLTSHVARSLVWSVYPGFSEKQDGFVDAVEPWSGRYQVRSPVWVSAHTTQFTRVGWEMLDTASGSFGSSGGLRDGGSYVTYASPERDHFSLVVEKLQGPCRKQATQATAEEPLIFMLTGGFEDLQNWTSSNLSFWSTNSTHEFVQLPDLSVDASGTFSFVAQPDTIYTVSTLTGQSKGFHGTSVRPVAPFPLPHGDDFDAYAVDKSPAYFADYSGSWQVALDPSGPGNLVLKQWVPRWTIGNNKYALDADPITFIGDPIGDASVSVDAYLPSAPPSRAAQGSVRSAIRSRWTGNCLIVASAASYAGASIEQQPCTKHWHGQFSFSPATGLLETKPGMCVSAQGCPASSRSPLCQVECRAASDPKRPEQTWLWGSDQRLRLRSRPSECLTAVDEEGASSLRLLPCSSAGGELARQEWIASGATLVRYAGVCLRVGRPSSAQPARHQGRHGYCLSVGVDAWGQGRWHLESGGSLLTSGPLVAPLGAWHTLRLDAHGPRLKAWVDRQSGVVVDTSYVSGLVALQCSWGEAFFDNFALRRETPGEPEDAFGI